MWSCLYLNDVCQSIFYWVWIWTRTRHSVNEMRRILQNEPMALTKELQHSDTIHYKYYHSNLKKQNKKTLEYITTHILYSFSNCQLFQLKKWKHHVKGTSKKFLLAANNRQYFIIIFLVHAYIHSTVIAVNSWLFGQELCGLHVVCESKGVSFICPILHNHTLSQTQTHVNFSFLVLNNWCRDWGIKRRNGLIEIAEMRAGDAAGRTVSRCLCSSVSSKAQHQPGVKGAGTLFTTHRLT
jgi:hypothetical protein